MQDLTGISLVSNYCSLDDASCLASEEHLRRTLVSLSAVSPALIKQLLDMLVVVSVWGSLVMLGSQMVH